METDFGPETAQTLYKNGSWAYFEEPPHVLRSTLLLKLHLWWFMLRGNCIGPALIYFGEYLSKERGLTRQIVLLKASSVIVSILFTSESLFFWCLLISVLTIFRPICEWYLIIIRTPKIKHDLFYGSCYGWTVWQYKKYQPMPCMVATCQVHKNVATCMLINNATDLWLHVANVHLLTLCTLTPCSNSHIYNASLFVVIA